MNLFCLSFKISKNIREKREEKKELNNILDQLKYLGFNLDYDSIIKNNKTKIKNLYINKNGLVYTPSYLNKNNNNLNKCINIYFGCLKRNPDIIGFFKNEKIKYDENENIIGISDVSNLDLESKYECLDNLSLCGFDIPKVKNNFNYIVFNFPKKISLNYKKDDLINKYIMTQDDLMNIDIDKVEKITKSISKTYVDCKKNRNIKYEYIVNAMMIPAGNILSSVDNEITVTEKFKDCFYSFSKLPKERQEKLVESILNKINKK